MAERTVPVPVSLIERIRDTYAGRDYHAADAAVLRLIDLLSQPWGAPGEPTKEQKQQAILEASAMQLASEERAVGYLPFDKHSEFPVEEHAYPSPLWCHNDAPHEAHRERNEYGDWNECTGRPIPEEES